LVFLFICITFTTAAILPALNNGGFVTRFQGETFYIADDLNYEDHTEQGALYRIQPNGDFLKLADTGGSQIWSDNKSIFISSGYKIYQINLKTETIKDILYGSINYLNPYNNTLYYSAESVPDAAGESYLSLYKRDLKTSKDEIIAGGSENRKVIFITAIKDTLYYYETSGDTITIYSYDTNGGKTKKITVETPALPHDDANPLLLTQLSACGNWLVYSIGVYQESDDYFYGDLYRIMPDGTQKSIIKINNKSWGNISFDNFTALGECIFYKSSNTSGEYYKINPDMSQVQKLNENVYKIIDAIGGYLYYQTAAGDIHRCKSDMSRDALIVKASDLPNFKTDNDYFDYKINVLNDTMYFNASVWGYRDGYDYREQFIDSTFNRVKLDGTGLQTLVKITSQIDEINKQ